MRSPGATPYFDPFRSEAVGHQSSFRRSWLMNSILTHSCAGAISNGGLRLPTLISNFARQGQTCVPSTLSQPLKLLSSGAARFAQQSLTHEVCASQSPAVEATLFALLFL